MIKETGGDNFEITRSLLQDLTFEHAGKAFGEESVRFGPEQKRTLELIDQDGLYTNLGLLLSDQCWHTIKAAVFEGSSKKVFKDRNEFSGSLFKQIADAYSYLDQFNHTRAELAGLKRIDKRDYPPEAVREALLNAVIHRDYSYSGSTLISIFEDRIEFVSLGGLPTGIATSDLALGVSVLRNNRLADIFYRLHFIEAYGTGVPKIMEFYSGSAIQPRIEVSDNAFKITLPNLNYSRDTQDDEIALTNEEQKIVQYLARQKSASRAQIENFSGFSQAKTIRLINHLIDKQIIQKNGRGKNTYYALPSYGRPV